MIDVHFINSPNGRKCTIMLEETGLAYNLIRYNLAKGEHLTKEFRAINPNARIPAIVDHDPPDGGAPYSVFESGAILIYLAEKTGQFIGQDMRTRHRAIQWVMWQVSGLGPMHGQAHHFMRHVQGHVDPYALNRYTREAERLLFVMNRRLGEAEYLAGDEYTIADIACWGWIYVMFVIEMKIADFPNIQRWYDTLCARPALQRGSNISMGANYEAPGRVKIDPDSWSNNFGDKMHAFHRTD